MTAETLNNEDNEMKSEATSQSTGSGDEKQQIDIDGYRRLVQTYISVVSPLYHWWFQA